MIKAKVAWGAVKPQILYSGQLPSYYIYYFSHYCSNITISLPFNNNPFSLEVRTRFTIDEHHNNDVFTVDSEPVVLSILSKHSIHTYIPTHAHAPTHTHAHTYLRTCTYVHTYMHTYIVHTYICTVSYLLITHDVK